jgi:two-component system, OmpR family, sensor histidine kinase KdpD
MPEIPAARARVLADNERMAPDGGHHKVFLGMAAGVGKTYRMLQEGQAEAEAGRDVVIGYLEPHNRPETSAQAEGLEVVPRRRLTYRDTQLEEMDLRAVIRRAPELCLVDEIAHTNAADVEHEKRYEDVGEIVAAGIDVYSTVNVQHLESLNDQVCDLTGVRVRETLPDSVLSQADQVVLMDLTPEALLERLREGRVYAPGRIDSALANFFKIENLQALREMALRQVAEDVESKRLVTDPVGTREDRVSDTAAPAAIGERLLALIQPEPASQRLVRRAWRSAQRLGAELDLLWVKRPGTKVEGEVAEQLEAMRRLAAVLGAHLLVEEGDSRVDTVRRVVDERGTTYVLMGPPSQRPLLRRVVEPFPIRLLDALPGVDVRIVADRTQRRSARPQRDISNEGTT